MAEEKREELREEEQKEKAKEIENKENKKESKLKEELAQKEVQIEEQEDRLKRLMAEFDNFKKRSAREKEGMYHSLIADITISLLPVMDNLEKAIHTQTTDEAYKQGIQIVYKQFMDTLGKFGIERIETVGKTFDPGLHEAVSAVMDETLGEKEIKEELRAGYKIGDKVIRHSMVSVAN